MLLLLLYTAIYSVKSLPRLSLYKIASSQDIIYIYKYYLVPDIYRLAKTNALDYNIFIASPHKQEGWPGTVICARISRHRPSPDINTDDADDPVLLGSAFSR